MKTLTSIVVAGALAVGAVAATAGGASADGYYYPHHHQYQGSYYYGGGDDGGAMVAAGIFGLATGLVASQAFAPPPPPYYAYPQAADAHIEWCSATYRSYSPETDTWRDYQGIPHQCVGPY